MTAARHPIVLACVGLMALVFFMADVPSPGTGAPQRARTEIAGTTGSGVFAFSSLVPREAAPAAARVSQTVDPPRPQAPSLPFSFLGKVSEGSETSIFLYRGGRTLTVRGPGRLDDNYEVESIQEGFLVLRYVPSGERQFLELASVLQAPAPYGSAADTPQD
jgi:hypothetical protein